MRWLKRDRRKIGMALAGTLLLLALVAWLPVSAVGAYEMTSGLPAPGTGTVQATPTEDATVTALSKEKLAQEIDQLKNQNYWAWTTIGPILVGFAGLLAALYSFITWFRNRQDEQKKQRADRKLEQEKRDEEQKRWLEDRQAEREKRAEERFQAVCVGLGSKDIEAKVGAAIILRTFIRLGYEEFYSQAFDLVVVHLRLRKADPNKPALLDSLSQALITVFKESFPLAREMLKKRDAQFDLRSLDATRIQLDNAYLFGADLEGARMREASLRKAHLFRANLTRAYLTRANFTGAYFDEANLTEADLRGADLTEADLRGANFTKADLRGANFTKAYFDKANLRGADLRGADLTEAKPEIAHSLVDTKMNSVNGLTKEQLAACEAKGANIDKDSTVSSSQSPASPPPPSQSNDVQAQSTPPAQGSIPTPDAGGSSETSSSQPSPES